ncbi:MAG: hypothetical protein ACRBDL_00045 [Alphaproteobacteria bacterium]
MAEEESDFLTRVTGVFLISTALTGVGMLSEWAQPSHHCFSSHGSADAYANRLRNNDGEVVIMDASLGRNFQKHTYRGALDMDKARTVVGTFCQTGEIPNDLESAVMPSAEN